MLNKMMAFTVMLFLPPFAFSQTQTDPAGTVGHTTVTTSSMPACGVPNWDDSYSGWYFLDSSGVTHTFPGSTLYYGGKFCNYPQGTSTTLSVNSSDGLYHILATGSTGVVTTTGVQGFINPKYVVVGVVYAPPGTNSFVQYTNTTSVGNTVTLSNTSTGNLKFTESLSKSASIPAATPGGAAGPGVKLTTTESSSYTQGTSDGTTNSMTQASTISYKFAGTNPLSASPNDADFILLWLNPELLMTYAPAAGSNPASLTWTGYAFDPNDPISGQPPASGPYISGPDILYVQVGCLNGHLSCPSTLEWLNGVQGAGSYVTSGALARTWQSAANGYSWPAGEVPGLTFNDVCNILNFDPFAMTPSQCLVQNNYTGLNLLPSTSADGKYLKMPYGPNPIQFAVGAPTESYNLVQTDAQTISQGTNSQIQQAFSVSESLTNSFLDLFSTTNTFTQSQTLTWTYSTLNALNTTTTLTDALSVTGPPDTPPYTGPTQYIGYQDNRFGTFVFVPGP